MSVATEMNTCSSQPRLRHVVGRFITAIWRLGSVRIARWAFGDEYSDGPPLYRRKLFGQKFDLPVNRSLTHQLLFLIGDRAVPERHLVRRFIRPGMHVVDVGANIGYYAAMFQERLGSTGILTLIEPSDENLPELKLAIELNVWKNVQLYPYACGAAEMVAGIRSGINGGVVPASDEVKRVELKSLDAILQDAKLPPADFIKIDVEGYEWEVLQGAKKTIAVHRPVLFLEVHPLLIERHGSNVEAVMEFLAEYYSTIECYDLPENATVGSKIVEHYLHSDPTRRIWMSGVNKSTDIIKPDSGRRHGTFWAICRP
jgi:FkbM family methyltransferase